MTCKQSHDGESEIRTHSTKYEILSFPVRLATKRLMLQNVGGSGGAAYELFDDINSGILLLLLLLRWGVNEEARDD